VYAALDHPEKMNAVDGTMHEELSRFFRDIAEYDPSVVVLTGAGDAFSAGGDIEWIRDTWVENPEGYIDVMRESVVLMRDLTGLEPPIIARVNGDAVGLGATLALHCDVVIADETAHLGDPHVRIGLAAGDGGAIIWPLLTSFNKAKEFLMTGDLITAAEAEELGIVNHAVPADGLDDKVDELVEKLTSLPQPAVRYSKFAANSWLRVAHEQILHQSLALEAISAQTAAHTEAVHAFLDDSDPDVTDDRDD
jgi:enoyl-CoA hydratase